MSTSTQSTSHTLLERACQLDDQDAWGQLYKRYLTFTYYQLRKLGLSDSAAEEVCQQVFVEISKKLRSYDREKGKFRSWFSQVILNTGRMYLRKEITHQKYVNRAHDLQQISAAFENSEVEELIQKEWDNYLLNIVIEVARRKFSGTMLQVFTLDLEGASIDAISRKTGLGRDSIYTFRNRVKKTLRQELDSIKKDLEW